MSTVRLPAPPTAPPAAAPPFRQRRQRRWDDDRIAWLRPILSLVSATLFAMPLYLVVANVFKPGPDIAASPWSVPTRPTLDNLIRIAQRPDALFWNGLVNSIQITLVSMVVVTILSAMLGYAIARSTHVAAKVLLLLLVCGLMIPSAVILTPVTQILRELGLMNSVVGLVLANIGYYLPFGVFVFAGFVRTVPIALEEAAAIDGAGRFRIFWQIVFPLMRPASASVLIFLGVWIWGDFLNPLIILGPAEGTTVTVGVYRAIGERSSDLGALFGFMFLASLPVLIFFVAFQRSFIKGLTSGATKS